MENVMELVNPERWLWGYDRQNDLLKIYFVARVRGTEDASFFSGPSWYGSKDCVGITEIEGKIGFSKDDVEAFENYLYCLSDFNMDEKLKYLMALNATAISRFHKESPLSDRYFKCPDIKARPSQGEVVTLVTTHQVNGHNQEATFLIIDANEKDCYAMLISNEQVGLDNVGGYLNVGSIIRVSNSRTIPMRCLNKELIQTLNIA